MYFGIKNYLKNTRNHTAKHAFNVIVEVARIQLMHHLKTAGASYLSINLLSFPVNLSSRTCFNFNFSP
jgi:hypothetical protein